MDLNTGNKFSIFVYVSVLTNINAFEEIIKKHGLPEHDYTKFDWKGLEDALYKLLTSKMQPHHASNVALTLWPDTLDSASKPLLSEDEALSYMQEIIRRLIAKDLRSEDLRDKYAITSKTESAPAQDIYFLLDIDSTTSSHPLEGILEGICEHFVSGSAIDPIILLATYSSNEPSLSYKLSPDMFNLFNERFDSPYDNDVTLMIMNEGAIDSFLRAN